MHEILQALAALAVCIGAMALCTCMVIASSIAVDVTKKIREEKEKNGK